MTTRAGRLRISLGVAAALAAALVVAGCGAVGPVDPAATDRPTLPPDATASLVPPVTIGPPPGPSPTPDQQSSPLAIDAALLAYLPPDVAGVPVTESLDEATLAMSNAFLRQVASAVDVAVAVDSGGGNLVYALVVQLQPGALGDEGFRGWRDSYDEGACSSAAADVRHAEAEIDGRTVYIGTCDDGRLRTYHVRLEAEDVLISAWSLGDGRFGELLVSDLQVED